MVRKKLSEESFGEKSGEAYVEPTKKKQEETAAVLGDGEGSLDQEALLEVKVKEFLVGIENDAIATLEQGLKGSVAKSNEIIFTELARIGYLGRIAKIHKHVIPVMHEVVDFIVKNNAIDISNQYDGESATSVMRDIENGKASIDTIDQYVYLLHDLAKVDHLHINSDFGRKYFPIEEINTSVLSTLDDYYAMVEGPDGA